jgi:hypothetical protein
MTWALRPGAESNDTSEHEPLKEVVLALVRTHERRRELQAMFRSMADVHQEEGWKKAVLALRKALVQQLRDKFGKVPRAVERTIAATDDVTRLHAWAVQAATASSLEKVGIEAER